jgi:hypothetical protein
MSKYAESGILDRAYGRTSARADVRADAQPKLVMTEKLDDAGRKHRTFAYDQPNARKDWLDPYRAQPQRMLFINKDGHNADWCKAREMQMLADEQQLLKHGPQSFTVYVGE